MVDRAAFEKIAAACRKGLLGLTGKSGSVFQGFPRAACGPAAEILGRIVKERLDCDGVYVCANGHPQLKHEHSHAWFEVGDFILDITHDQFDGTGLSGWVFQRGTGWHSQFTVRDEREGFCMPSGWPLYPHDGYQAALEEVVKDTHK